MKSTSIIALLSALYAVEAATVSTVVCPDCVPSKSTHFVVTRSAVPTTLCTAPALTAVYASGSRSMPGGGSSPSGTAPGGSVSGSGPAPTGGPSPTAPGTVPVGGAAGDKLTSNVVGVLALAGLAALAM